MSDTQISEMQSNTDRLNTFSDGVVAVIITLMVLELKAPAVSSFAALVPLWPEAVSYAVSYLFIAIIWVNHHHLMRFVSDSTPRLIWINFIHLFLVALVPFATQWVARTDLGAVAVSVYAGLLRLHRRSLPRIRTRGNGSSGLQRRSGQRQETRAPAISDDTWNLCGSITLRIFCADPGYGLGPGRPLLLPQAGGPRHEARARAPADDVDEHGGDDSCANPAVTLARSISDTFAGIGRYRVDSAASLISAA